MLCKNRNTRNESQRKIEKINSLLSEKGSDALLLQRFSSIAWATCGADSHINTAASDGCASLLITPTQRYVFTDTIEAQRLQDEQGLDGQDWEFIISPWYEKRNSLTEFIRDMKVGTDGLFLGGTDISAELAWLRSQLTENEVDRFRTLGKLCAQIMNETMETLQPGMTEYQIAGKLSQIAESYGVQPVINLVGSDERIFQYRHPLPTSKKLDKYCMVILCGRKWGLVCSITRLVHFGPLPDEVKRKSLATALIDAAMIAASRPGKTLADVFRIAQNEYEYAGYAGEWQKHHQGGLAGYEPREITATPFTLHPVKVNQVFAWNPTITGAKSEDTILISENENEILTEIPGWSYEEIQIGDQLIRRPMVMVRD
ncbi:MAG TPA: peptidase M24 [Anaerolineaceae bacterium]|nr:peptidase M24 [Anaerolineaceae bacterium]